MSAVGRLNSSLLEVSRQPGLDCEINFLQNTNKSNTCNPNQNQNLMTLLTPEKIKLSLINTSISDISVSMDLQKNSFMDPIKFIGQLFYDKLILKSGEEKIIEMGCVSTQRGVHKMPEVVVRDLNSQGKWQFDDLKLVFVH